MLARKQAGVSQKALGVAVGIDEFSASSRMNHYEQGLHAPNYELIQRIASHLKLPTSYFYTDDDGIAELVVKYFRLKKGQRKELMKYLEGLAS